MSGRFKILIPCIVLFLFVGTTKANRQLLQDPTTLNLIKTDIGYIYNLQFNEAQIIYSKIEKIYPDHPVLYLLSGLMTYWKNYPLLVLNPAHTSFEEDLRQCIRLSERNDNDSYEAEYLLSDLCARGMLLKFYGDNNLTMEVIPMVIGSYKYLKQSFNFTNVCPDLYYFTGVYNYYREAYPKAYPVYKPISRLFRSGNMETGLKQLQNAAINATVLGAESSFILTWIYLNFENNYQMALRYCTSLHEMYPNNVEYLATYLKILLLTKQYDEAERQISTSQKVSENKYFQAQLLIFKGILEEKKYHNNNLAQQYYISGISKISLFGEYGNEYEAYAYFGLSRISDSKSEKTNGKIYRKKAMKLGDFKKHNFDK